MRVLVCGGRDMKAYDAWNWLEQNAREFIYQITGMWQFKIEVLIHGGARGADEGAAQWGESEHAKVLRFDADWKKHGKAAGPMRNLRMIREGKPDIVIALPGGIGTANMIAQAEANGIQVIKVETV